MAKRVVNMRDKGREELDDQLDNTPEKHPKSENIIRVSSHEDSSRGNSLEFPLNLDFKSDSNECQRRERAESYLSPRISS